MFFNVSIFTLHDNLTSVAFLTKQIELNSRVNYLNLLKHTLNYGKDSYNSLSSNSTLS